MFIRYYNDGSINGIKSTPFEYIGSIYSLSQIELPDDNDIIFEFDKIIGGVLEKKDRIEVNAIYAQRQAEIDALAEIAEYNTWLNKTKAWYRGSTYWTLGNPTVDEFNKRADIEYWFYIQSQGLKEYEFLYRQYLMNFIDEKNPGRNFTLDETTAEMEAIYMAENYPLWKNKYKLDF